MTRDWYFYLNKGKTVGPIDRTEVKSAIERGQIGPFDLLFREGENRWQPIQEFAEFRGQLRSQPKAKLEDTWVVLVKQETRKGLAYLQRGPFTTQQIQDQLQSGEIQYRDFIWQEGQNQWSRISVLGVFNPPPVQWKPETQLPHDVDFSDDEVTAEHDIEEIMKQSHDEPPKDFAPPEANTPDLTKMDDEPPPPRRPISRTIYPPTGRIPVMKRPDTFVKPWPLDLPRRFSRMRLAAGVASLGLLAFLFFHREEILQRSGIKLGKQEEEVLAPTAPLPPKGKKGKAQTLSQPVPPAPTPEVKEPEAQPSAAQVAKATPTRLSVSLSRNATLHPQANFSTDGSFHFPIKVLVTGEAGEILERVSLYREVTVRWAVNEAPRLDLGSMGLGDGKYKLVATLNGFEDRQEFRVGGDDREFRGKLERHRKLISLPFQRERRRFIRAASDLRTLSASLQKANESGSREALRAWKTDYQEWSKNRLSGLSLDDPKGLVFPMQWQIVRESRQAMVDIHKSLEKNQKKDSVPEDLKKITASLSELAAGGQKLSLYR